MYTILISVNDKIVNRIDGLNKRQAKKEIHSAMCKYDIDELMIFVYKCGYFQFIAWDCTRPYVDSFARWHDGTERIGYIG